MKLPAGSVVAIVGENGAGKTTLVKLLAKMYEPTSGRILVDRIDLARIAAGRLARAARGRLPGLLPLRVSRPSHRRRRRRPAARRRAGRRHGGASCGRRRRHRAVDGRVGNAARPARGRTGVDVSFGQWQKLALARGFMRDEPIVLVLDEPTAALDAETEHALVRALRGSGRGMRASMGASRSSCHIGSRPCGWPT